jgi:hypothetical protein
MAANAIRVKPPEPCGELVEIKTIKTANPGVNTFNRASRKGKIQARNVVIDARSVTTADMKVDRKLVD